MTISKDTTADNVHQILQIIGANRFCIWNDVGVGVAIVV